MWENEWERYNRIKKHEIVHFCFSHINDTDRTAYLRLKLIQDLFFSVKLIITEMSTNGKSINYRQSSFWISIMWVSIITSAFHFTAVIFFRSLFVYFYFVFFFFIFVFLAVIIKANEDICDMFDMYQYFLATIWFTWKKNIFRCARVWFFILYWSLSFSVCKPIAFFSLLICKTDTRDHLRKFLNNVRNAMTSTIWKVQFHIIYMYTIFAQLFSLFCAYVFFQREIIKMFAETHMQRFRRKERERGRERESEQKNEQNDSREEKNMLEINNLDRKKDKHPWFEYVLFVGVFFGNSMPCHFIPSNQSAIVQSTHICIGYLYEFMLIVTFSAMPKQISFL